MAADEPPDVALVDLSLLDVVHSTCSCRAAWTATRSPGGYKD
jgi:hypothetical protein